MAQENKQEEIQMIQVDADQMYNGIQIFYCTMIVCFDKQTEYEKSHITDSINIPYDKITKMTKNEIETMIKSYIKISKGYIQYVYFYSVLDDIDQYIKQIQNVITQKLIPIEDVSKTAKYFQLIPNGYKQFANKFPFLCRTNQQTTNPFDNDNDDNNNNDKIYEPIAMKEYPNQIIADKLYLGDIHQAYDKMIVSNLKITHIINCTHLIMNKFERNKQINIKYLKLNVGDQDTTNIAQHFERTANFINNALNADNNNRVLIHCHAGVSRSSTITIAYLMRTRRIRYDEAFNFVKEKRQFIQPNQGFIKQLKQFEKQLFSNTNPFISDETNESKDD